MKTVLERIMRLQDGESLALKNEEYHIYTEDCFDVQLVVSNTCFEYESPDGNKKAAFYLKNKKNVEIDGHGATVIVHGVITPFLFVQCKNVKIKNLTVKYARPTMSEFEIVETKKGKVRAKISPEFLYRLDGNKLVWLGEIDQTGVRYWEMDYKGDGILSQIYKTKEKKLEMLPRYGNDKHPSFPDIKKVTETAERVLDIEFEDANIELPVNSIIQTRNVTRKEIGGAFDGCQNLIFENVTVHNMNGMGLVFQNCKDLIFSDCRFVPLEGKIIVSNADFLHFSGCKGKILVKNCVAVGAHDDVINVHGTHLTIIDKNDEEKSLSVRFKNLASWGFNAFKKGEKIELVHSKTLIPYAKARIKEVEKIDKYNVKLYLYGKIKKDINFGKDAVENVTRTASLRVENCRFERISSRAVLCTTRKPVLIKNCIFKDMCGPVLYVADDCNFWYESGRSGNVKFINNQVIACDNGFTGNGENVIQYEPVVTDKTSKIPVHKKLTIKGNQFKNSTLGKYIIKLEYLKTAKIFKNTFDCAYEVVKDETVRLTERNNRIDG